MVDSKKSSNNSDRKIAKNIEQLQAKFDELMSSELKAIQGESRDRQASLSILHNRFLELVKQDVTNVSSRKSPNQSTYDFIASAITGKTFDTKDVNRGEYKRQLNQLFSGGDAEIASYFMSNGIGNMHIYDEIDSICAYMYQNDEAIDIIRDCVFASDQPAEGISMDIKFEGIADSDSAEYKQSIIDMFRIEKMTKKLVNHVGKKAIKYGKYYIMIIPYKDIHEKLSNLKGSYGTLENTMLFESVDQTSGNKNTDSNVYTLESAMADVAELLNYVPPKQSDRNSKPTKDSAQYIYDTICENLKSISVCENNEPPNVSGMNYSNLQGIDQDILDAITRGNSNKYDRRNRGQSNKKGTKAYADGLIDKNPLEGIKGCYQKLIDPRQLRPIKIFDYTIGYYYAENYNFEYSGTSITDLLSNSMQFDQKTQIIDRLVDSVLGKLTWGNVMKGDKQFRNLILNCIMYTEQRDNPIRIKFVPVDYVIPFETNTDENGNGQPVLLRSLVFSRLYISMLLFFITAIITKSTDSEFYYLKESALDPGNSNQISEVMDQLSQCNMDPLAIAQGQMLNVNKAINKRYYMSLGISGDKAFDIDVMNGQNIDIHMDFLTDIKKQAISSTGVPSVMIDMVDEIEYATMANMANIKNLRRCNTIQLDFNGPITEYAKTMATYTTNIPPEVISKMYITLRPSKIIQNNITSQQLNDSVQQAETMIKNAYKGDNSGELSELDKRIIDIATRELTIELTPAAPWAKAQAIIDDAVIKARVDIEREKAAKGNEQPSE